MNKISIIIDPWVIKYELLQEKLREINMPNKLKSNCVWLLQNIHRYKKNFSVDEYSKLVLLIKDVRKIK